MLNLKSDGQIKAAPVERFQFSVGTMMAAVLYAAGLATVIVDAAGADWKLLQVAVAYAVTIISIGGFAAASRARGRIAAYLLISPLVFIAAISAASVFAPRYQNSSAPLMPPQVQTQPQQSPIIAPLKP